MQLDDGRYEGWVVDYEVQSVVIKEEQERCLNTDGLGAVRPSHLLLYDDGQLTPVVVKAGGWLRDDDGDAHRLTKLGHREYVDQEKNTHRCDACGQVLWNMQALRSHTASRWCIPVTLMNTPQQPTRRQARERVARRKGEIRGVIPVKLEATDGTADETVVTFVYLGSNITRDWDVTKEARRRIGMAGAVFATLGTVWDSSIVPLKLKSALFRSLVVSVLVYNAECWPMRKNNTDAIEGFIYRCLRRVTRIERDSPDPLEDHPSRAEVFSVAASPHAQELVRETRLH